MIRLPSSMARGRARPVCMFLYCSLLHYKLYLVCKIRHKMDVEGVNPEGLRDERFKDFWDAEKAAVDQVSAPKYGKMAIR